MLLKRSVSHNNSLHVLCIPYYQMLAYATCEKVISCILCSPLALYIHPVEFVADSPAPTVLCVLNFLKVCQYFFLSNIHANPNHSLKERFYPQVSDNPLLFFLPLFFFFFFSTMHLKRPENSRRHPAVTLFCSLRGCRGRWSLLYQWGGVWGCVLGCVGEVREVAGGLAGGR